MGCGKTTAGKRLALKLGYEFVDLDHVIEAVEQRTIAEIFEQEGQNAFRLIEQRELHNTFNLKNTIVSTGGGAPCFFDNIEQMNKHGNTVYIQLTPKT
jgi:shikimate kinase